MKAPTLLEYLQKLGELSWLTDCVRDLVEWNRRFHLLIASAIVFYAQPIALWMFIPCDKKGNPMQHPDNVSFANSKSAIGYRNAYNSALDRRVFEGFNHIGGRFISIGDISMDIQLHKVVCRSGLFRVNYAMNVDDFIHEFSKHVDLQFTQSVQDKINIT